MYQKFVVATFTISNTLTIYITLIRDIHSVPYLQHSKDITPFTISMSENDGKSK